MTKTESFIWSQIQPLLNAQEQLEHTAHLVGFMKQGGTTEIGRGVTAFREAARTRACFVALTNQRMFFLWSKPGRVGAFGPLLECEQVEWYSPDQVATVQTKLAGFGKRLEITLRSGQKLEFHLKRRVGGVPDQARCLDTLIAAHCEPTGP